MSANESVPHPMQPVCSDSNGTVRFKDNAIVRFLLDNGPNDLNKLAMLHFTQEDREQFAQLIGYSVSGYGDLSYVSPESVEKADAAYEALMGQKLEAPPAREWPTREALMQLISDNSRELLGVWNDPRFVNLPEDIRKPIEGWRKRCEGIINICVQEYPKP